MKRRAVSGVKALKGMRKDTRQLAQLARRAGWTISRTNGGHYRWTAPDGTVIISAGTSSDWRAHHNLKARISAAGT